MSTESANVIRAILLVAALGSFPATAAELAPCFTPGENCTREIVDEIDSAKESLLVQAYEFTSYPIINAIIRANDRGVDVSIILDQDNDKAGRSGQESIAAHL